MMQRAFFSRSPWTGIFSLLWLATSLAACGTQAERPGPVGGTRAAPAVTTGAIARSSLPDYPPRMSPHEIADALWELVQQSDPLWSSYLGNKSFDARLEDLSAQGQARWWDGLEALRNRLGKTDPKTLGQSERIEYDTLKAFLDSHLGQRVCRSAVWDINQLSGHHVELAEVATYTSIESVLDASNYLQRLAAISSLLAQHEDNLRAGLGDGFSAPKINVERVIAQLEGMLAKSAEESPYLGVVAKAKVEKELLRGQILAIVRHGIRPALKRYLSFLQEDYLPKARTVVGVLANPEGKACYRAEIARHTGLELPPEAVHALGISELKRLHEAMDALAEAEGHADWRAYGASLAQSPDQFLDSPQALLDHNLALVERAEKALPKVFKDLPEIPVKVRAIEAFRAAEAPAAYYYKAPDDGSRPAYYYVNTHNPKSRPLFNMEALAYHEAVPGHHLQIAKAQSVKGLADFRRHMGLTAYVEGWALYAELVADELGLYSSASTKFGMYNYQAWRAARLVVDTGIHAMGWTREQAIDFMMDNLMFPKNEMVNEVERYIGWPGQALAYMVGRMEIQKLRLFAQTRLGDGFDIRAFHDEVLRHGAVPLDVLTGIVQRWVASVAPDKSAQATQ